MAARNFHAAIRKFDPVDISLVGVRLVFEGMLRVFVLWSVPFLVSGRFTDNKTVWGQDEDEVIITIKADCKMETHSVEVVADRFTFQCEAWNWREEWETVKVDFVTREDVVPSSFSACSKRDRTAGYLDQVTCRLEKYHQGHLWDRLTEVAGALDLRYDWGNTATTDDYGEGPEAEAWATAFDAPYAEASP